MDGLKYQSTSHSKVGFFVLWLLCGTESESQQATEVGIRLTGPFVEPPLRVFYTDKHIFIPFLKLFCNLKLILLFQCQVEMQV